MPLLSRKPERVDRIASWAGEGQVLLRPDRADRSTWVEAVGAVAVCLAVDLIAMAASVVLAQRSFLTVCGNGCFDNARAHIHDDVVTFWSFGVAVVGLIAISLIIRHARIPVVVTQVAVAVFVLVNTVPAYRSALHQQNILDKCDYGYRGPCVGVLDLSPHT